MFGYFAETRRSDANENFNFRTQPASPPPSGVSALATRKLKTKEREVKMAELSNSESDNDLMYEETVRLYLFNG